MSVEMDFGLKQKPKGFGFDGTLAQAGEDTSLTKFEENGGGVCNYLSGAYIEGDHELVLKMGHR